MLQVARQYRKFAALLKVMGHDASITLDTFLPALRVDEILVEWVGENMFSVTLADGTGVQEPTGKAFAFVLAHVS